MFEALDTVDDISLYDRLLFQGVLAGWKITRSIAVDAFMLHKLTRLLRWFMVVDLTLSLFVMSALSLTCLDVLGS